MEKEKIRGDEWSKIFIQQTFINTDKSVWNTNITMALSLPWRAYNLVNNILWDLGRGRDPERLEKQVSK